MTAATQTRNATSPNSTPQPTTSAPGNALTLREAVQQFDGQLEAAKSQWAVSLPPQITPERFKGVVVTAVNLDLELLKADRRSLVNACCQAARDGLLPDKREGALVIYNTKDGKDEHGKDRWIKKVQWIPMVYGIIKKARQSGEIATLGARCVYQHEVDAGLFKYVISEGEERLNHEPMLFGERGPVVLAYAYCKFKSGTIEYECLTKGDIDKIRSVSKAKDSGPWVGWFEEMAKKSAIRRLSKRLPLSAELHDAIQRDDELTEFEQLRDAARKSLIGQAAAQLSAPVPPVDNGDVIDGESEEVADDEAEAPADEVTEREETALERGVRLLDQCANMKAVNDLSSSIGQALDGAELAQWDQWVATKREELTKHIGKK